MKDGRSDIYGVFLKYRDALVRALIRLSVKPEDVDDILQETLARAADADRKNTIEQPKSYLFAVSRNIVYREHERRTREVLSEIDEATVEASQVSADEALHSKMMLDAFWEALASLPQDHQRAILMRRVYGLSQKDVARKMGVSVSSVDKYLAQGMKRCRSVLRKNGYDAIRERTRGSHAKTDNRK